LRLIVFDGIRPLSVPEDNDTIEVLLANAARYE
jgi:hypothetical protein